MPGVDTGTLAEGPRDVNTVSVYCERAVLSQTSLNIPVYRMLASACKTLRKGTLDFLQGFDKPMTVWMYQSRYLRRWVSSHILCIVTPRIEIPSADCPSYNIHQLVPPEQSNRIRQLYGRVRVHDH